MTALLSALAVLVAAIGIGVNRHLNPPSRRRILDEAAIRDAVHDLDLRTRLDKLVTEGAERYVTRREAADDNAPKWATGTWIVTGILATLIFIVGVVGALGWLVGIGAVGMLSNGWFLYTEYRDRWLRRRELARARSSRAG